MSYQLRHYKGADPLAAKKSPRNLAARALAAAMPTEAEIRYDAGLASANQAAAESDPSASLNSDELTNLISANDVEAMRAFEANINEQVATGRMAPQAAAAALEGRRKESEEKFDAALRNAVANKLVTRTEAMQIKRERNRGIETLRAIVGGAAATTAASNAATGAIDALRNDTNLRSGEVAAAVRLAIAATEAAADSAAEDMQKLTERADWLLESSEGARQESREGLRRIVDVTEAAADSAAEDMQRLTESSEGVRREASLQTARLATLIDQQRRLQEAFDTAAEAGRDTSAIEARLDAVIDAIENSRQRAAAREQRNTGRITGRIDSLAEQIARARQEDADSDIVGNAARREFSERFVAGERAARLADLAAIPPGPQAVRRAAAAAAAAAAADEEAADAATAYQRREANERWYADERAQRLADLADLAALQRQRKVANDDDDEFFDAPLIAGPDDKLAADIAAARSGVVAAETPGSSKKAKARANRRAREAAEDAAGGMSDAEFARRAVAAGTADVDPDAEDLPGAGGDDDDPNLAAEDAAAAAAAAAEPPPAYTGKAKLFTGPSAGEFWKTMVGGRRNADNKISIKGDPVAALAKKLFENRVIQRRGTGGVEIIVPEEPPIDVSLSELSDAFKLLRAGDKAALEALRQPGADAPAALVALEKLARLPGYHDVKLQDHMGFGLGAALSAEPKPELVSAQERRGRPTDRPQAGKRREVALELLRTATEDIESARRLFFAVKEKNMFPHNELSSIATEIQAEHLRQHHIKGGKGRPRPLHLRKSLAAVRQLEPDFNPPTL